MVWSHCQTQLKVRTFLQRNIAGNRKKERPKKSWLGNWQVKKPWNKKACKSQLTINLPKIGVLFNVSPSINITINEQPLKMWQAWSIWVQLSCPMVILTPRSTSVLRELLQCLVLCSIVAGITSSSQSTTKLRYLMHAYSAPCSMGQKDRLRIANRDSSNAWTHLSYNVYAVCFKSHSSIRSPTLKPSNTNSLQS